MINSYTPTLLFDKHSAPIIMGSNKNKTAALG